VSSLTVNFVQELISHFKDQKLLHRKYVVQILLAAIDYFKSQPSLLRLKLPASENSSSAYGHFTVCGDTHGQFYDLCNIFEIGGFPSPTNPFLFNGDYVDRGSFSFEVVMTLIALKLACPTGLYLLRGNHETKNMNSIYGFQGEILHKYDETVMKLFTEVFNNLPLAAVIQDSVFVVHGGLSTTQENGMTLEQIEAIPRDREPPESGLMSDLLWSDPHAFMGKMPSKRGVGFSFGPDYTEQFLNRNNLQLLVRSHEVKDDGYAVEHGGKCITIFSAPN
jgi:serine/threonine-protein phosphatase 5